MSTRMQRGQALILIALAFVGLAAFIGLAVDAGILFTDIGHLRRAVDAASLSAANQIREGSGTPELTASARQVLALNGLDDDSLGVAVETRLTNPGDPELDTTPPRKLVRVRADMPVYFAFLPIIGFNSITIHANAIAEAASLDLVLALDTSDSEAFDASCSDAALDGNNDDDAWAEINLIPGSPDPDVDLPTLCAGCGVADAVADDCDTGMVGAFPDDYMKNPDFCNPYDQCRPFRDVQDAAISLTDRHLPPYDRMAIVNFDRNASVQMNLNYQSVSGVSDAVYLDDLEAEIMDLQVFKLAGCPGMTPTSPDPFTGPVGCTSTNTADGLIAAGNQFGSFTREEAVWIVILLSDGGANAATDSGGVWICPGSHDTVKYWPNWVQPFCRDPFADTRHIKTAPEYDPDDAARDRGDWVGCLDANAALHPGTCAALAPGYGQGAVIFAIGLGSQVVNNSICDLPWVGCEPDTGEQLLRYIAAVGDDGDPTTDPCNPPGPSESPVGDDCGNYYFSPTGAGLLEVFEAIASRVFTRITH